MRIYRRATLLKPSYPRTLSIYHQGRGHANHYQPLIKLFMVLVYATDYQVYLRLVDHITSRLPWTLQRLLALQLLLSCVLQR
jgi:hypothetical protein